MGRIDGIVPDGKGGFFLTVFKAGKLMHFDKESGPKLIKKLSKGTADLTFVADKKLIYLPIMMSDELRAYSLSFLK